MKVVKENGKVVAFGPDDDNYQPYLKAGQTLEIAETAELEKEVVTEISLPELVEDKDMEARVLKASDADLRKIVAGLVARLKI